LHADRDSIVGVLDFGGVRIAEASMGYKHRTLDPAIAAHALAEPGFLLKIVPHVDGSPRICELVRYTLGDVTVKGAWTGPVALDFFPHALAPVADLPIREIVGGVHLIADLTLNLGEVVHDYLA
jgi:acetoacetate decarboxylase